MKPFQGRADLQGVARFTGLLVSHAAWLPRVQVKAAKSLGRPP